MARPPLHEQAPISIVAVATNLLHYFCPGTLGRESNPCDAIHFWSQHIGGAKFLFVDGSVRFLAYSAAPLMPALATRASGETVTLPEWARSLSVWPNVLQDREFHRRTVTTH
jgi:prepilin-type processing-associated H-X9-DG protein